MSTNFRFEIEELDEGACSTWYVNIHKNSTRIGWVEARRYDDSFTVADIEHSSLESKYHGLGLGFRAYEVLYTHLKKCGIKTITGGSHSSGAARVHQKLALKYGYKYPYVNEDASTGYPYDRRFGSYRYALK